MSTAIEFEQWSDAHCNRAKAGTLHLWPSETLVRLLRGRFLPDLNQDYSGKTILDVGCGDGNNLFLYAALGLRISATEVTDEICRLVRGRLASIGCEVDARVGMNRDLPFDDASFDYLVSWNAIHYETTESEIRAAIAEYARILKPGGRFFLSTTGPDHLILDGAEKLGPHRYRIAIDDFRRGQTFFYFETCEAIVEYFGERFDAVRVGRDRDALFTKTADFFLVTGVKR